MIEYFEQIIFLPKPKEKREYIPSIKATLYTFDHWIVGGEKKKLWVKCPICNHAFELNDVENEQMTKHNLKEYDVFNYRKAIRKCPNKKNHIEVNDI